MGWEEITRELLFHVRWAGKSSLRSSVWAEPEVVRERVSLWGEISHHTLCTKVVLGRLDHVCLRSVGPLGLASETKHHTLEGLRQQSLILYTGAGSPRSRYGQGQAPSTVLEEWMPACLCLASLALALNLMFHCVAATYASDTTWPFPCLCASVCVSSPL